MGTSNFILTLLLLIIYVSSLSSSSPISLSSTLPPEFSILHGQENDVLSTERVSELFVKWKEVHGKVYDHQEEEERRLGNFRNSLKFILERNSKRKSEWDHTVGLTKFADLSNEEFKEMYFSKSKGPKSEKLKVWGEKGNTTLNSGSCDAPASLDWRDKGVVTPMKDQGQCGSCWAFSVTGSIEGAHAIATGDLISLSEQELVSCDTNDYGCDGGNMDTAYRWIIKNGGLNSEEAYPYTSSNGRDGKCDKEKSQISVVSISSYVEVESNEDAVLCAVAKQPVTIGICGSAYDFQLYTGGIYNGQCSSSAYSLDHAVLIVGYGTQDGEDYWIVKNQWGTYWGLEGYVLMKRGSDVNKNGVCGMYLEAMYPIPAEPSPPSPPAPPSPPHPPPPPPAPTPDKCGNFHYCAADQTCCCILEFYNYCFMYGCCGYTNAVCCKGSSYCCPSDYPVCDIQAGYCFKKSGGTFGVAAKKRQMAKHKMPWEKVEETVMEEYQPMVWKRK
ncbi:putative actinidain [Helianthus annuus]|uniref:Actinidain n=2 Tax=Helianthus annuus TaxID=4232 RepID=A0A251UNX9_HELAN|nr:low-temperature-induced cysteine proteinase [Helianthus annuus]KAF5810867.1 putative actinidain [Helianthus annuus]KAJ0931987.1 putative actinidain [Helianthus annuus]